MTDSTSTDSNAAFERGTWEWHVHPDSEGNVNLSVDGKLWEKSVDRHFHRESYQP